MENKNTYEYFQSICNNAQVKLKEEYCNYLDTEYYDKLVEEITDSAKQGISSIKIKVPVPEKFFLALNNPRIDIQDYLKRKLNLPRISGILEFVEILSVFSPIRYYYFIFRLD